ncbi:sugar ABC transporter permease [Streptomyces sp. NPDC006512]|uniref:sugar ABC transporter permease n=1 Tax=Streptomyces sp. NPDC006512 TaxID=3154307 RepID=UPI0033A517A8
MNATGGPDWACLALEAVMERVAVTEAAVGDRFPLYAEPADGRWKTTGNGSWAGGFWAGLLWLRARYTGSASDHRAASLRTARLAPWAEADTATRGLILWYGTSLAQGDPDAAALRARAARACLSSFDPALGIVPWGAAFGGPRLVARADGVPGTVPLLAGAGPAGAAAAAAHLHRHLDLCVGAGAGADGIGSRAGAGGSAVHGGPAEGEGAGDGVGVGTPGGGRASGGRGARAAAAGPTGRAPDPRSPAWSFDGAAGWRPCADPEPGWSRGDAWLLLAVADALLIPDVAAHHPARLEATATLLSPPPPKAPTPPGAPTPPCPPGPAELPGVPGLTEAPGVPGRPGSTGMHGPPGASGVPGPLAVLGRLVPPALAGWPGGPLDTSAAAITAVALLKLARLPGPRAAWYAYRAEEILGHLVREHVTGPGPGRPAGMLLDGCYDAGRDLAVRHELIWGDFFLALGLAALCGLVDLTHV